MVEFRDFEMISDSEKGGFKQGSGRQRVSPPPNPRTTPKVPHAALFV
jgi:hypothetical protein